MLRLSKNIPGLMYFTGEFSEIQSAHPAIRFIAKEHPLLNYQEALVEEREWIVPEVTGFFQSFSKYYQKCIKFLHDE